MRLGPHGQLLGITLRTVLPVDCTAMGLPQPHSSQSLMAEMHACPPLAPVTALWQDTLLAAHISFRDHGVFVM